MKSLQEGQQFSRVGRLDDIGIGAEVVRAVDVALLGRRTEHHGDETLEFRSGADVVEDIETSFPRHLDVEQQKMGKGIGLAIFKGTFAEQIV